MTDIIWICNDCAKEKNWSMNEGHLATFHVGRCDICKEEKAVTEPRDYRNKP